jgi:hypothetical protein
MIGMRVPTGRYRNAEITCVRVEVGLINVRIALAILPLGDLRLGDFFFGLGI